MTLPNLVATVGRRTYQIPQMWIAGYTRNGASVADAVRYWHEQEESGRQLLRDIRADQEG